MPALSRAASNHQKGESQARLALSFFFSATRFEALSCLMNSSQPATISKNHQLIATLMQYNRVQQ
jgi:hypothetical protein